MCVPSIASPAYWYHSPMFLSLKIAALSRFPSLHPSTHGFSDTRCGSIPFPCRLANLKNTHLSLSHRRRPCSSNGDYNIGYCLNCWCKVRHMGSQKHTTMKVFVGSAEKEESEKGRSLTSNEILKRLRRYGVSGILSYGLLNTAYYLTTFLFVWLYIAPAPGRMGCLAAVKRFLKVMAMVWAGSQVTKLIRAGGALALAPFVDRGLSWFTVKFNFESQGKASMAIVGFCFGLAVILFLVITLLWA